MSTNKYFISIIVFSLFSQLTIAQNVFTEVGIGIGNVVQEEHSLGKSEIYFNISKSIKFGDLGLDFSTGGNFIPGSRSILDENTQTEILSPNDTKFGSISLLYRLPIGEYVFVESRAGYASLSYFVHTDTEDKVKRPNFTYGISLGATLYNNCIISLCINTLVAQQFVKG